MKKSRFLVLICVFLFLFAGQALSQKTLPFDAPEETDEELVPVQILSINDFHGQLEKKKQLFNRPVGSAPVLASYLQQAKDEAMGQTFFVHAGDLVGASPPISALLQDEPSIMFFNLLGNEACNRYGRLNPECNVIGVPGNHEFDEGVNEMLRLIRGGNHPKGPFIDDPFTGAHFPYICANVIDSKTGQNILHPFTIRWIEDIPLAFIGVVLKETAALVSPSGVKSVAFLDEVTAINKNVQMLKAFGVKAFVVVIHQGGRQDFYSGPTRKIHQPLDGEIIPILDGLDAEVDVVITGHHHSFTNTFYPKKGGDTLLVVQAYSKGKAYADIDLKLSEETHDVAFKTAAIVPTYADEGPGLTPYGPAEYLIADATEKVGPIIKTLIGKAKTDIPKSFLPSGESALGNLIADAQRKATGSDMAFMNPGGIRAGLTAGDVTWGDLFTVQPFGNTLVTMDLSGQAIYDLLNQQWANQPFPRILQISGLTYTWRKSLPENNRIVDIRQNGVSIDRKKIFKVTVNSFLASGGDKFSTLLQGKNKVVGKEDLNALIDYIKALDQPFTYQTDQRIMVQN